MKKECYVCGEALEVGDKCIKVLCSDCIYDRLPEKVSTNSNSPWKNGKSECPRFEGCSAPLCLLDKGVADRVYLKGEPVCKAKPGTLRQMLGKELERRYREFVRVSVQRGARFVPWRKVKNETVC